MARSGFKWSINEVLRLQREFELLNLDINTIASNHKRTPEAIMRKLDSEGFADYNVLYSNYHDLNSTIPTNRTYKYDNVVAGYDTESEVDSDDVSQPYPNPVDERLNKLENIITAITEQLNPKKKIDLPSYYNFGYAN